jgi:hypothetical protein
MEQKTCPRCGKLFECKSCNIRECQCFGLQITALQRNLLAQHFDDCLCRDCLSLLQNELKAKNDLALGELGSVS